MKAIVAERLGEPEVMELKDLPEPAIGETQILVEVQGAGVNPVDTYIRQGDQGYGAITPYTPGIDGAGVILKTGAEVKGFKKGQRVYFSGTVTGSYSQLAAVEENNIYALPDILSFSQGACLGIPYATAYRAIFQRAQARAGDRVLVHGASGGVGTAAVQILAFHGMEVYATAGTDKGRQLILSSGASVVEDHNNPDHLQKLMDATEGKGFDVILEMLANVNLGNDLPLLGRNGRVVVIGSRGTVSINPRDLMGKDGGILGMSLMNTSWKEKKRIHRALYCCLSKGLIKPAVGLELPLKDAPMAHHRIMTEKACGNIVLQPWQ